MVRAKLYTVVLRRSLVLFFLIFISGFMWPPFKHLFLLIFNVISIFLKVFLFFQHSGFIWILCVSLLSPSPVCLFIMFVSLHLQCPPWSDLHSVGPTLTTLTLNRVPAFCSLILSKLIPHFFFYFFILSRLLPSLSWFHFFFYHFFMLFLLDTYDIIHLNLNFHISNSFIGIHPVRSRLTQLVSLCVSPLPVAQTREPSGPEELHLLAESECRGHSVCSVGLCHVQSAAQKPVMLGCLMAHFLDDESFRSAPRSNFSICTRDRHHTLLLDSSLSVLMLFFCLHG